MENTSEQDLTRKRMRLHEGLPRQGPGSDAVTAQAVNLLPAMPSPARIYDLGCGPGRATVALASILKEPVVALDLQQDFLRQVRDAAEQKGLSHLIETQCGDMTLLPDQPGTINLIWAEGAIYCAGFDRALGIWRPLLAENGIVACSELSWLTAAPSAEPAAFWLLHYPGMRSVGQNIAAAEALGYKCIAHFTQPVSSWWDQYYNPWLSHIQALALEAEQDQDLRKLIDGALMEIELFRKYSHEYGYEFYLLQK